MTSNERRAVSALSLIMALRMVGLFMILPVFALYAHNLQGVTPTLLGLAMGIYGLTQALLQIPFGALSDRLGRKPIICCGLLLFAAGSLIAAMSHTISGMIIGRALQGTGAVGSTIMAMIADLTREQHRTKAMAIAGMTIGLSFSVAMVLGPILTRWIAVGDLFFLATIFSLVAIGVLYTIVPKPAVSTWHRETEPELSAFSTLFKNPELMRLNSGIFILHVILTASFVAIPITLQNYTGLAEQQQGFLYTPTLLLAFIFTLTLIIIAEKKQQLKSFFIISIIVLALSEALFWLAPHSLAIMAMALTLFLTGFSVLEAFLPSLVSKTAPAARKGTALGIYSCAQFFGIFVGGLVGGLLYQQFHLLSIYLFCVVISLVWLIIASSMKPPRHLSTYLLKLSPSHWQTIEATVKCIPGVAEAAYVPEEGIAYLRIEKRTLQHPDFLHLQETLQSQHK
ncbi:MAG: hypothetical protein A3J38_05425 [Gammaproteobacteria bacterium RIFCSPHIGHO2_12_FULL_45_9]|nr:MAG: hypothetical protein A3J38_05425 [Gammaproteobacteria bacterium RIFCSPHIGHO2_12_FULL_45_9]